MAPYDDWNTLPSDDDDSSLLQDPSSFLDAKKDVILFCIDCSPSMLALRPDPLYEDPVQTCHLFTALEAAVQIQKRKIVVGPGDKVGVLLFNTTRRTESRNHGSEIKRGTFVYQPIAPMSAPKIQEIMQLLDAFREDPQELRNTFPPLEDKKVPMGDVFTSCNWVLRDGAPKTATKRVFLITDDDDPHSAAPSKQLVTSARTTLGDLSAAGVTVEPFFISTDARAFDPDKFYSSLLTSLPPSSPDSPDDEEGSENALSITRITDLLAQMRFHEAPKRALFSVALELAPGDGGDKGFLVGVKGYGLVTEQKKGAYKYFVDLGDRMDVVDAKTVYVDEAQQSEIDKSRIVYGMSLSGEDGAGGEDGPARAEDGPARVEDGPARVVRVGSRPFYTAEDVKSFRTLGMEPVIKLLGFKDRRELLFEDNIKHSSFIYPDEYAYSGSRRTFTALLKTMLAKDKIGIVLALTRRNSSPMFCVMLPQAEKIEDGGWNEPAGFHLIPLPFADDIRAAPIEVAHQASEDLRTAAQAWVRKLCVKNGAYPPDSYPNPALAYHNEQLQASAFREEYDPQSFEDLTLPNIDMLHKRAGKLLKEWKDALRQDDSATIVDEVPTTGTKRKADTSVEEAEIRSKWESGGLAKMRVDQLKEFLKSKSEPVSGKKADLLERVSDWLEKHD
ncbi:hypothetical protein PLICRDRAFT_158979 [Plicaturopsis crispa FD-325 SS-3]|nr:hypothetical protein PLICRDRAFT_158979 [Plicaturopsis crispa FD-325 SS-3]